MQIRIWSISAKYEKKLTLDQSARAEGYRFIRDFGPRANNRNQFMEWADEQVHTPGGKLEGWNEGKVREALSNYYRRQTECQDVGVLAIHFEVLRAMVSPWHLDQDVAYNASTWHHLDRQDSGRQVLGLQDSALCAISFWDWSGCARRSCSQHCDSEALGFLQGGADQQVQARCLWRWAASEDGCFLPESVPEPWSALSALMSWSTNFLSVHKYHYISCAITFFACHTVAFTFHVYHFAPLCRKKTLPSGRATHQRSLTRVLEDMPAITHTMPSWNSRSWRMHPKPPRWTASSTRTFWISLLLPSIWLCWLSRACIGV